MSEIAIRFVAGGLVVTAFAILSDLLNPKTFAGLFGAAPSVALASVALTVCTKGKEIAAIEARSMILGAIALLIYAGFVSRVLMHFRAAAWKVTLGGLLVWLGAAIGLWYIALAL